MLGLIPSNQAVPTMLDIVNDTSAFLTVTSASPDSPVWLGSLVIAVVIIVGISVWVRVSKTPLLAVKTVTVATLAAVLWGVVSWVTIPSTPTVNQAILMAFSVELNSAPDQTDVLEGAKLSGRSLGGDEASCFITPAPVDAPKKTVDLARMTLAAVGTVVATCTSGPPPPQLDMPGLQPPPPPAAEIPDEDPEGFNPLEDPTETPE